MDQETLKLRRLFAQYLLAPDSRLPVVRAMDGFQAQFLSNAMHAMRLRSADPDAGYAADGLVKSWTLRGTMHLFAEADLPLFLHDGCRYHSRDWTVPSFWNQRPDWALTPQRQAYFSDLIVDTLTQGPMTREALKVRCRAAGMTEAEEASMFHPWGGGIRELCERGFLCGTASEEKAFRLCPPFVPMAREDALQEQLRRYLASFGPVSLRDAAYFFALPQARLRALLMQLPVSADSFDGQTLYSLDDGREAGDALPDCLLLAGFDPLMLGYEKKQESDRARRDAIPEGECVYFDEAYERCRRLHELELAKLDVNMFAAIDNSLINDGCGLYRGRLILPYEHLSRFQNDLID